MAAAIYYLTKIVSYFTPYYNRIRQQLNNCSILQR